MKQIKYILLLFIASCALASCTKDTQAEGNIAVGFKNDVTKIRYSYDFNYIPITIEGASSKYPVKLDIKVTPTEGSKLVEGVDYLITSKQILVQEDVSEVNVELRIENKKDAADLSFELEIINAENAQTVTKAKTLVNVQKTDYDHIQGSYGLRGYEYDQSGKSVFVYYPITITNDSQANVDKKLLLDGWGKAPNTVFSFYVDYSEGTKNLRIPMGMSNKYKNNLFYFDGVGAMYVCLCAMHEIDGWDESSIVGTWNSQYSAVNFDFTGLSFVAMRLYDQEGNGTSYVASMGLKISSITRKNQNVESSPLLQDLAKSNIECKYFISPYQPIVTKDTKTGQEFVLYGIPEKAKTK